MPLTLDTQAVLLLYAGLGQREAIKPLTLKRYNTLAAWLKQEGMRPGDLLSPEGHLRLNTLASDPSGADVAALLERGASLGLMIEKWERAALWVISRSDPEY